MIDGDVQGLLRRRPEPGRRLRERALQRKALRNLDWLVVRDIDGDRDRRVLVRQPRDRAGEVRAEDIGTEVFFLPAAAHTEKDGTLHQHPAAAAVARQGGRAAGRLPLGAAGSPTTSAAGIRERAAPARPTRATGRSSTLTWDYPTQGPHDEPRRRRRAAGDQRPQRRRRRSSAATRSSPTTARRPAARGCTPGSTPTASTRPRAGRPHTEQNWIAPEWGWAWPAEPPHPLQPRLGRPGRQAVVGAQALRLVGRRGGPLDRRATTRTSSPTSRRTIVPDEDANGHGRDRAATTPFIAHPDGLGWLYAPIGPRRRAAADALRAARVAVRQPALRAGAQPDAPAFDRPGQPATTRARRAGRRGLPVRHDDLPAHRAPHRGRHVAHGRRTSPSCSPRCSARSARRSPRERGLEHGGWATIVTARAAIEARVLVTDRMRPLTRRWAASCTRSALPYHWGRRGLVTGDAANELLSLVLDLNVHISEYKALTCDMRPGRRPRGPALRRRSSPTTAGAAGVGGAGVHDAAAELEVAQPTAARRTPRVGFFTDTSAVHRLQGVRGRLQGVEPASRRRRRASPATPTTTRVDARRRHLAPRRVHRAAQAGRRGRRGAVARPDRRARAPGRRAGLQTYQDGDGLRWLMASDVCKHCTHAACLEVCPTGALFRTEFGTVVVQQDVCNGCGYCVPACPFGVLDRREDDGRVWKCTLCYDRLKDDQEPACAQACPTNSIQFGELDDLRERAEARLEHAARRRVRTRRRSTSPTTTTASAAPARSSCCSTSPRSTGCRPTRSTTTRDLGSVWAAAGAAAVALGGGDRGGGARRPGAVSVEGATVARRQATSYYGRPVHQAAGLDAGDPDLLLRRRHRGRLGRARAAAGLARQRRAGAARVADRGRRRSA